MTGPVPSPSTAAAPAVSKGREGAGSGARLVSTVAALAGGLFGFPLVLAAGTSLYRTGYAHFIPPSTTQAALLGVGAVVVGVAALVSARASGLGLLVGALAAAGLEALGWLVPPNSVRLRVGRGPDLQRTIEIIGWFGVNGLLAGVLLAVGLASALRGRQRSRIGFVGRLVADVGSLVLAVAGAGLGLWTASGLHYRRGEAAPFSPTGYLVMTGLAVLILVFAGLLASVGPDGLVAAGLGLAAWSGLALLGPRLASQLGLIRFLVFNTGQASYAVVIGLVLLGGGLGVALRRGAWSKERRTSVATGPTQSPPANGAPLRT